MLFRKKAKTVSKPAPFAGMPVVLDGRVATLRSERIASEMLVLPNASSWDRLIPAYASTIQESNTLRRAENAESLLGLLEGLVSSGIRATGFTDEQFLDKAAYALVRLASRRLPLVIHHLGRPGGEEPALVALSNHGPFLLYAASVQEAVDFSLIAHHLAELALFPGICLQESQVTGHSIQSLALPDDRLLEAFLGMPEDEISSPTPSQEIIFGSLRRRLPLWLDLDRPLGIGAAYDSHTQYLSRASEAVFFHDHLDTLADEAFARYGELTGRRYDRVQAYRTDDAEYVVIAEGAIVEPLEEVVDYLRNRENVKAGLLKVNMRRPFPGPRVSSLLKGKKGVAVVAHASGNSSESSLMREVRSAIERSAENGRTSNGRIPYPTFDAYKKPTDHPWLYEAFYGDELTPRFSDLHAIIKNMLPGAEGKRQVFLGEPFRKAEVRLPKLESLQQRLFKAYADLDQRMLAPISAREPRDTGTGVFVIVAESKENTILGADSFTKACKHGATWSVRTRTSIDQEKAQVPGSFYVAHALQEEKLPSSFDELDAVITTSPFFWNEAHLLRDGGLLVTEWNAEQVSAQKNALGRGLSILRKKNIHAFGLDTTRVIAGLASDPREKSLLAFTALLAAFVEKYAFFSAEQKSEVRRLWATELSTALKADASLEETFLWVMTAGAEQVTELPLTQIAEEIKTAPEQETPWTVRAEQQIDGSLYDLGRFWDSTGFLYESRRQDQMLASPFLALESVPASSSPMHDHASFRDRLPFLDTGKCTACGTCWITCPDSALPVTIQDAETLVATTFQRSKNAGHDLLQLQRIQRHIAPQAQRLFAENEKGKYGTFGALLQDTFDSLLQKLKPAEEQRKILETEFALFRKQADAFPIVKTETFFNAPEAKLKGTGLLFSLVLNPEACKACGLCVEVCPEDALEMKEQKTDELEKARANWSYMRQVPDVPVDRLEPFIDENKPGTQAFRFLNRHTYHAVLGGDLSEPGSGMKTATHIFAGLTESTLRPRVDGFVRELSDLMVRIEKKIDESLREAVHVDDLSSLSEKLSELKASRIELKDLAPVLRPEKKGGIDRDWLARLAESYRQLSVLKNSYEAAAHGDGRARMIMGIQDEEITRWARNFPHNPYPFPWVSYLSKDSTGLIEGIFEGVMRKMSDGFRVVRIATLNLENKYKPAEHDPYFNQFSWRNFTDVERALCPPVVLLTSGDIGSLDSILSRNIPVKILSLVETGRLINMNPGSNPAHSTALSAITHHGVFVLQSSIGFPDHLMRGFLAGLSYPGPAVFSVYAPSPSRDGIAAHEIQCQARNAVLGRVFPLFQFDPSQEGAFFDQFDLSMNPMPDSDWPVHTLENISGGDGVSANMPFTFADWALSEGILNHHFSPLSDEIQDGEIPLSEYLDLPEEERIRKIPYVTRYGSTTVRNAVSEELVRMTGWYRVNWRLLQSIPLHRPVVGVHGAENSSEAAVPPEIMKYHALLTRKLLALSGYAPKTGVE